MTALDWNQVLKEAQNRLSSAAKPDLKPDNAPFCQADLLFEPDTAERLDADQDQDAINPSLASQEPQKASFRYDRHNYQAQGETPPPEPIGRPSPFTGLVCGVALALCGAVVWAAWVTLWPETIKWLLWMAGK